LAGQLPYLTNYVPAPLSVFLVSHTHFYADTEQISQSIKTHFYGAICCERIMSSAALQLTNSNRPPSLIIAAQKGKIDPALYRTIFHPSPITNSRYHGQHSRLAIVDSLTASASLRLTAQSSSD